MLVHLEDEEGNPLGNYNVMLCEYDTEKELIDLLEDYWGYKKNIYKEYYLKVIDWPHNPGPSEWWPGSSLHVCEMEERISCYQENIKKTMVQCLVFMVVRIQEI